MEKHSILFKKGFLIIGLPVLIAIFLRLYCFDTYRILSTSMTPTLIPGDFIVVSKMSYGPRMLKVRQFFKDGKNEYSRLKGFGTIKRGDLVVFNWPNYASLKDSNQTMFGIVVVKRCYGIPGDTVMIRDDGSTLESASKQQQKDELFPHDSTFKWTISNYGPLFVPGKGFSIKLTDRNIRIYKDVLAYEGIKFFLKGDSVFLNKRYVTNYTFKNNYYFMKGDNFYGSMDSRYWGFVPENNVIGKTIMVLFSNGEDGFQWKRLFHLIK
jgi:signal peptidase I